MKLATGNPAKVMLPDANAIVPKFPSFQKTMLDATPDCIKLISTDGKLLAMNRAGCLALNVPLDSDFGMLWLPLLSSDVQEIGLEALSKAAAGASARFPGKSESPGLIYWDNLLTPVVDESGAVRHILCVSRDVTAKVALERELQEAIEREKLLSNEMQHRIKNLFSVVSALILISEKEAAGGKVETGVATILREKLAALARASDAAFAPASGHDGGMDHDLGNLIKSVLQPYGDRCGVAGGPLSIGSVIRTTLALFLHELATNSVKYGALSNDVGVVAVRWEADDEALDLTWVETGGPSISKAPARSGFGREMVDRLVQSAGGRIDRKWLLEGLVAKLHLPNSSRA